MVRFHFAGRIGSPCRGDDLPVFDGTGASILEVMCTVVDERATVNQTVEGPVIDHELHVGAEEVVFGLVERQQRIEGPTRGELVVRADLVVLLVIPQAESWRSLLMSEPVAP